MESQDLPPVVPEPTLPEPTPPTAPEAVGKPAQGMAEAGMWCSALALLFSPIPYLNMLLTLVLGVPGIVCGAIGTYQARRSGHRRRLALAAVICGVLALVLMVAFAYAFNVLFVGDLQLIPDLVLQVPVSLYLATLPPTAVNPL